MSAHCCGYSPSADIDANQRLLLNVGTVAVRNNGGAHG